MQQFICDRRQRAIVAFVTGAALSLAGVTMPALVTLMLSTAPESRLRGMVFWMIGDLAGAPFFLYQLHHLHQLRRA